MSQVGSMRDALKLVAERQDATVSRASCLEGVPPDVIAALLSTIRKVRSEATDPLLDRIDLLERALTDACENLTRVTQHLESALAKLKFFDMLKQSGGMLHVDLDSVHEIAAWRAQTADWLEGWLRDVARQSADAQKATDGQGN